MITNKIIDRITDMTSSNAHNFCYGCPFEAHYISKRSEFRGESRKGDLIHDFLSQKNTSKCLNFVFKDQTPTFLFSIFFAIFFDTKCERHKKQEQEHK